jgi:hypothetical protein
MLPSLLLARLLTWLLARLLAHPTLLAWIEILTSILSV